MTAPVLGSGCCPPWIVSVVNPSAPRRGDFERFERGFDLDTTRR